MSLSHIPKTLELIDAGCNNRDHAGAQVYVSIAGNIMVDTALGWARDGVKMETDTIVHWLSSSKPVTAIALARIWEKGEIHLDDPVHYHIPEFGILGKEKINIRHLLTHTAGIRNIDTGNETSSWDATIKKICAMPLDKDWPVGNKAAYHMTSSWFILGEIIRRIDGRSYSAFVRDEIFLPLDMTDSWIGMPPDVHNRVSDRISGMHTVEGGRIIWNNWHTATHCAWVSPGSNGKGPIREIAKLYEMLLNDGNWEGKQIISPQSVAALTARHRTHLMDHTFMHQLDWGLGFIIDSNHYGKDTVPYGFGKHCSPSTFGHSGRQSSAVFADPVHRLVVALAFNGMPGERPHQKRIRTVLTQLYEDLGLVNG